MFRVRRMVLLLTLCASSVVAFKDHEFKTCDTNPFCKRNRNREPATAKYAVTKDGVAAQGLGAKAVLEDSVSGQRLSLDLRVYKGGQVRVTAREADAAVRRLSVPDVLEPGLDKTQVAWDSVGQHGSMATRLVHGDSNVVIEHSPFALRMYKGSNELLKFNSQQLLHYELQGARQENHTEDMWEAKFKGFTDKIRFGPTSIMFDVSFPESQEVYGLPEHATAMALKPTKGEGVTSEPYRLYNLDVFEYLHDSPFGLYGSIPFLMAHGVKGSTGVFWLNAAEMYVDVSRHPSAKYPQTSWFAESGLLDVFLMPGPSPANVVQQYSALAGNTYLPPLFSIGYHQCRWNYRDEADVDQVDDGFDENIMPYDVIWLDIEHTNGKRYFTWDKNLFPTPARMQNDIASKGRKMVNIVDPHIKRDDGYYVHKEATSMGLYVKDSAGKDYEGWCWPGSSSYLDFTNPQVRNYWASKFSLSQYEGSTSNLYIWNDMNEPSVFNGPEISMPKDLIHYGDWEHRDVHNLYGYYLHMATSDGLMKREPGNLRPFVLSRAFYAGTQRIGPIWTGDNGADWNHLKVSLPMLLTLGLSGLTFSGADVGGFFGNPDAELMIRWYQVGAFYPFFRGHAHQETKRREPWLFGEPSTTHIRNSLRMRYNLLPYMYTLFAEASETNAPIMRPLFYEFPQDPALFAKEDAFMVGPAILVAPVLAKGQASVQATLPGTGVWYRLATGAPHRSPDTINVDTRDLGTLPVFVRGGYIVPRRERPRRSTAAMQSDPYTLLIALDLSGQATGYLYEDDGMTVSHKQGAFIHRKFEFSQNQLKSTARSLPVGRAIYSSSSLIERIVILGMQKIPKSVTVQSDGRQLVTSYGPVDPISVAGSAPTSAVVIRKPELPFSADWALQFEL